MIKPAFWVFLDISYTLMYGASYSNAILRRVL